VTSIVRFSEARDARNHPVMKFNVAIAICGLITGQSGMAADLGFATDIRPILSDKCFQCHGPDKATQKGGLRLDIRDEAIRPRDGIIPIAAGNSTKSEVVRRIFSTDPDEVMPPPEKKNPLSVADREKLKAWIDQGAEYTGHWAFQRIEKPVEPAVKNRARRRNAIDAFVLARLEQEGYGYAKDASKEKLIRRVAFDITGLPPTLEEIDAFLKDKTPKAFENIVDDYLSRTTYAERMTSEWMDVARYSDTYGYQVDRDRFVWPYRDWVIKAFDKNLPYSQFITEQVAGDLIPNATEDQILATAFNRLHPQKVEGGSVPEEFRIEYVSDRTQTFATAFLGLTMECSKCHDHKYDPISQKEFYGLTSFFDNIDEAGLYSYFTPSVPTPTLQLRTDDHRKKLTDSKAAVRLAEQKLKDATERVTKTFPAWAKEKRQAAIGGLVGSFSFDDRIGGIIPNAIRPDLPGSASGNNPTVEGRRGKGIKLSGDDAVNLKVGNFTRNQAFSIACWINSPEQFERSVVFHRSRAWTDAASRGYELLILDGRLQASLIHFWPGNSISIKTTEILPTNEWIHVSLTYDGSSRASGLQLWINGKPARQETVRDKLTKNITGGGGDTIAIGQRFRDVGFKNGLVDEFKVFERELSEFEIRDVMNPGSIVAALGSQKLRNHLLDYFLGNHPELTELRAALQAARKKATDIVDRIPEIMVMQEMVERQTYLLHRGAYDARRDQVSSITPASLHEFPGKAPKNRLGLAEWLTSRDNPLTARVTVNRYWQMIFGRGLVKTANDFGSQGALPTHPELLDWLAADFMENSWDLKRLIKQFVMSTAYRQSSIATKELLNKDPENILLGRARRYRLPAEMIRDNALFLSGLLVPKVGGQSVKPYEVKEAFKPATPDKGEGLYRRSLYTYWKRTAPAPVMMALDAARRDVCSVTRETTATPLQAFVFMNDPQFVEAARKLAERALDESDPNAAVRWMFRVLTSRKPNAAEQRVIDRMFEEQLKDFTSKAGRAGQFLKTGKAATKKGLDPNQLAALNVVATALLSHDECVVKR
tara:strand:- start:12875 stop:16021 length:3147 start_codon:yes stop_codon:yes gene_type:complete